MRHGAVVAAARRETGYRITGHFLQLSGMCAACAAGSSARQASTGSGPAVRAALPGRARGRRRCGRRAARCWSSPASSLAALGAGCGGERRRAPATAAPRRRRLGDASSPTSPRTSPATASRCARWCLPTPTCTPTSRRPATWPASPAPTSSSSTAPVSSARSRTRCARPAATCASSRRPPASTTRTPQPGEPQGTRTRTRPGRAARRGAASGETDPHFWLDPTLVEAYVANDPRRLRRGRPRGRGGLRGERRRLRRRNSTSWTAGSAPRSTPSPPRTRQLVMNHASHGYFADRYGFTVVGAVIPSVGTGAAPTARQLAELTRVDPRDRRQGRSSSSSGRARSSPSRSPPRPASPSSTTCATTP